MPLVFYFFSRRKQVFFTARVSIFSWYTVSDTKPYCHAIDDIPSIWSKIYTIFHHEDVKFSSRGFCCYITRLSNRHREVFSTPFPECCISIKILLFSHTSTVLKSKIFSNLPPRIEKYLFVRQSITIIIKIIFSVMKNNVYLCKPKTIKTYIWILL